MKTLRYILIALLALSSAPFLAQNTDFSQQSIIVEESNFNIEFDRFSNSFTKTSPIQSWPSGIISFTNLLESGENGFIKFRVSDLQGSSKAIGFMDATANNFNLANFKHMFLFQNKNLFIFESNVLNLWIATVNEGDEFIIEVRDGSVYYYLNDEILCGNGGVCSTVAYSGNMVPVITINKFANPVPQFSQVAFSFNAPYSSTSPAVDQNISKSYTYDEDGNVISESRVFFDQMGRAVQTQAKDFANGNVLAAQTIYDAAGRGAFQSLSAPIYQSEMDNLKSDFIQNDQGQAYTYQDFNQESNMDSPEGLNQSQKGSLGWYYSNNNDEEQYVPHDAYPFNTVEYSSDPLGRVKRVSGVGKDHKMGSGHEQRIFHMTNNRELAYVAGSDWLDRCVQKTITVDSEGLTQISYTNSDGQLIASAISGLSTNDCGLQEARAIMDHKGTRSADLHIPEAGKAHVYIGINFAGIFGFESQISHSIIDLDKNKVLELGTDYNLIPETVEEANLHGQDRRNRVEFIGDYASGQHFLRFKYEHNFTGDYLNVEEHVIDPKLGQDKEYEYRNWYRNLMLDQHVDYKTDYAHWTLNEYDDRGQLTTSYSPKSIDCSTAQFPLTGYQQLIGGWVGPSEHIDTWDFSTGSGNANYEGTPKIGDQVFELELDPTFYNHNTQFLELKQITEAYHYYTGFLTTDFVNQGDIKEWNQADIAYMESQGVVPEYLSNNFCGYVFEDVSEEGINQKQRFQNNIFLRNVNDFEGGREKNDAYVAGQKIKSGNGGMKEETVLDKNQKSFEDDDVFIDSWINDVEDDSDFSDCGDVNFSYCYPPNNTVCGAFGYDLDGNGVDDSPICEQNAPSAWSCFEEGNPPQLMGTYAFDFSLFANYNGQSGTESETIDDFTFTAYLMRTCNCRYYWTDNPENSNGLSLAELQEAFLQFNENVSNWTGQVDRDYTKIALELEDIRIKLSWETDFSSFDEQNYFHHFARYVGFGARYRLNTQAHNISPAHTAALASTYSYDALGRLIQSNDPDRGESHFQYDQQHQLRFSQDAQQAIDNEFSYINYDRAGRITESGIYNESFVQFDLPGEVLANGITPTSALVESRDFDPAAFIGKSERTVFAYDFRNADYPVAGEQQNFTLGLLTKVYNIDETNQEISSAWYDYDYRGQVSKMAQSYAGVADLQVNSYAYDYFGQLTQTGYSLGQDNDFFHAYEYDANFRMHRFLAGTDLNSLSEQAEYRFEDNGAMKRSEIGNHLQGMDYIRTINGWIKAMNNPNFNAQDPGADAVVGKGNDAFAPDLFAMDFQYFANDYVREGSQVTAQIAGAIGTDKYNGLIRATSWQTRTPTSSPVPQSHSSYSYSYDELNRLQESTFGELIAHVPTGNNANESMSANWSDEYKVSNLSYDKNGNILSLHRNGNSTDGLAMDQLSYFMKDNSNQLSYVKDAANDANYSADFKDHVNATENNPNYEYNAIGQLVADYAENNFIQYNELGKVRAVYSDQMMLIPKVKYTYNAHGHRFMKESYDSTGALESRTHYYTDSNGNTLHIHNEDIANSSHSNDFSVLGSARIGQFNKENQEYRYELADHLGNVRVTFKEGINPGTVELIDLKDYYPFGSPMPGKSIVPSNEYTFSYQGQELDKETGFVNFALRQYDPRLGKWLSPDPYFQHHSPYLAMSNNPVSFIDPDGGESVECQDCPTEEEVQAAIEIINFLTWAGHHNQAKSRLKALTGGSVEYKAQTISEITFDKKSIHDNSITIVPTNWKVTYSDSFGETVESSGSSVEQANKMAETHSVEITAATTTESDIDVGNILSKAFLDFGEYLRDIEPDALNVNNFGLTLGLGVRDFNVFGFAKVSLDFSLGSLTYDKNNDEIYLKGPSGSAGLFFGGSKVGLSLKGESFKAGLIDRTLVVGNFEGKANFFNLGLSEEASLNGGLHLGSFSIFNSEGGDDKFFNYNSIIKTSENRMFTPPSGRKQNMNILGGKLRLGIFTSDVEWNIDQTISSTIFRGQGTGLGNEWKNN